MTRSLRGKSVIVVGAGLAGLTAAVELQRHGAAVTVLEGQDRVGGRVLTIRDGFVGRQHAEAGADFIDEEHEEMCRLVRSVKLKLVPVLRAGFSFALSSNGTVRLPVSGDGIWKRLTHHLAPLIHAYRLSEQRWDGAVARTLGAMSVADWMKEASLPRELRHMLVGLRGFFLADPADLSLLSLVDQVASGSPGKGGMYRIAGGNDQLPKTLASMLHDQVLLRHEVCAVSQSKATVRVRVRTGNNESWLRADYLILALPATRMRMLEIRPALPCEQAAAVSKLSYGPVTKTLLQFDRRFWNNPHRRLAYGTNLPIGAVWDANEQQKGKPGILCLMAGGTTSAATRQILSTPGVAGLVRALDWLGKSKKSLVSMRSITWEQDPWVYGGYAVFGPGFDPTQRSWLARPCGRILFAGEHTSLRWQGYMNGAVESGLRAAAEVLALSR
ncbi:MAG: FAD-dependent oxidoreductase [Nitrospira sp.]